MFVCTFTNNKTFYNRAGILTMQRTTTLPMANPQIDPIDWTARIFSGLALAVVTGMGVVLKSVLRYRIDNRQMTLTHEETEVARQERRIERLETAQGEFQSIRAKQDELVVALRTQVAQLEVKNENLGDFIATLKQQLKEAMMANESLETQVTQLIVQNSGLLAILEKNGIHVTRELKEGLRNEDF